MPATDRCRLVIAVRVAEEVSAMVAAVYPAPPAARVPLIPPLPTAPRLRRARDLARACDRHFAACWRGEADWAAFGNWLDEYRCSEVIIPPGPPAAVSPHGAGGRGLAWYDVPGAILGSAVGVDWGYRVPLGAVPPQPPSALDRARRSAVIGQLHPDDIESVLHHQHVGRLACLAGGRAYVVPITYAYAGGDVYGQTLAGRKLAALRTDPRVCFEVDERADPTTWCSVVAEGIYEEVTDAIERRAALGLLAAAEPVTVPPSSAPSVVFRLRLTEKTGRFTRQGP
jgi:nitroimidazol reductase NimA-like FMN-containing flavoprotein (pyridoxamine 5'-phosphate oxidase superfamily)